MDQLLYSSESSDDEDAQGPFFRTYRERINFTILNNQSFLEAFRLSRVQVEHLLTDLGLGGRLDTGSNKSMALTGEQRLLLSLSWMGNGGQYHAMSSMHGVSKSTVCRILKEVVECLFDLAPQTVCWPQQTQEIADHFYAKGRFPNVCDIVDGTMINMDAPADVRDEHGVIVRRLFEETFVNRKVTTPGTSWPSVGPTYLFMWYKSELAWLCPRLMGLEKLGCIHSFPRGMEAVR